MATDFMMDEDEKEQQKIKINSTPGKPGKKKTMPRRSPPAKDRPVAAPVVVEKPPPIKIKLSLKSVRNQQESALPKGSAMTSSASSSSGGKKDHEKSVNSATTQHQILLAQQEYEKRIHQITSNGTNSSSQNEANVKAQNQLTGRSKDVGMPPNLPTQQRLTSAQISALQYQMIQQQQQQGQINQAIRPMPPTTSQVAPQFLQMARYAKQPPYQKNRSSNAPRPMPSNPPRCLPNAVLPQQQQQQTRYQTVKMVTSTYSNRIKTVQAANALVQHAAYISGEMETNELVAPIYNIRERILTRATPIVFTQYDPKSDEILIPVSIEVELRSGLYLKDTFTWNISDATMTPRKYAELLGFDLDLSPANVDSISTAIQQQIEYYTPAAITANAIPLHDSNLKRGKNHDNNGDDETTTNIPIHLEVQVGKQLIRDRFLWDSSPDNPVTPEQYAKIFVAEYGLGGETVPMIATSIREQILIHAQQEYILPFDDFESSANADKAGVVLDVQDGVQGIVTLNNQLCQTTVIDRLTKQELADLASKRDRQARRMRRETTRLKRRAHF